MADLTNASAAAPVKPGHTTLPLLLPEDEAGPPSRPGEANDPYRFGWRYLLRTLSDGTQIYDQVPLSWDDLLYPEEGDFVVQEPAHTRDFVYCQSALEVFCQDDPSIVVLGDCRVDFDAPGLRPLGPDVLVLIGVDHWERRGTFHLADEGGQPAVLIEITSPGTRGHDLYDKPDLYHYAGVEKYVIVDRGPEGDQPVRLLGFRRGPQDWLPLPADARGRLDLSPIGVWIGVEGERTWLYDAATGERLPDLAGAVQAKRAAEAATQAADARTREEVKARIRAEMRSRRDARARAAAETKAREDAAARAEAEAARAEAEARARDEAERRAALEARLRELEEQLRRRPEPD